MNRAREYTYQRPLSVREQLPAIGAGIVTGLLAFYVARIFIQRTPLDPGHRPEHLRARPPRPSAE